jgi:hypothetical protein
MQSRSAELGEDAGRSARIYIFVIVKVPDPEQPVPLIVHVPEMVFPVAVPVRVIALPAGVPEFTANPKVPFTLPLVFPLSLNDPVAVSLDTKHGELLVKGEVRDAQRSVPVHH